MNFSDRTAWNLTENELTRAVREARQQGRILLDLTVSNPTACGFTRTEDLLAPLSEPAAASYTPEAFGMVSARAAAADYYRDHGVAIPLEHICLTTSTSEAYSYLFRLLCNPGDEVLVARPSYPLFDYIAQLDDVVLREFPLQHDPNATTDDHAAWSIDLQMLERGIGPRTRAIILVHPNNPTGSFILAEEREAVQQLCDRHGLALIVDEVFLDYMVTTPQPTFAAETSTCLTFVLSGLSKVCALPQMKCSWIVSSGPVAMLREALARLEVIADTFLSMNAPIQNALPFWLGQREDIQRQIRARMRENLGTLDRLLLGTSSHRLSLQGGWTAILRVPRTVEGVPFVEAALAQDVLVQPGDFYGLPEGRAVLSLLTPADVWLRGLQALPLG
ncbi:pyridoxal phosphate-dependent aminotransferase [Granulicella paludicola]|uniref:pyridoxal phosphate-dependent aminotransferase n=1 Tax=Granulicella paludicola TaxID=474951 RepID=UPI0021DF662E|nr:pyridoxal phosphate-dependent aminotransferase [Granulicella paludicola]